MKTIRIIIIQLIIVFAPHSLTADLQRLAILPQVGIKITQHGPAIAETMCIDYFRDAPSRFNVVTEPRYNQVYSEDEVIVKIDGQSTNRSFESMVTGDTPLLLIEPNSMSELKISLNPKHPQSMRIKSIELEFKKPTTIGNLTGERDVQQTKFIFQGWGYKLSQKEFWDRAICLDILSKNSKINYTIPITQSDKELCSKLLNKFDFRTISQKTLKDCIERGFVILDENLELTAESIDKMHLVFQYEGAIEYTRELNEFWSRLGESSKNDDKDYEAFLLKAKISYYENGSEVPKFENERDTIINGIRHVAVLAFKSQGFKNIVKANSAGIFTYTSRDQLFDKALFVVAKSDLDAWIISTDLKNQNEASCQKRLIQLLGLPPTSANDQIVEFWIKEEDLFKPTVDSSMKRLMLLSKISSSYIAQLGEFSKNSINGQSLFTQYPFTGFGYTYDYHPANKTHRGLSEFVLKEKRTIYIRRFVPLKQYIENLTKK